MQEGFPSINAPIRYRSIRYRYFPLDIGTSCTFFFPLELPLKMYRKKIRKLSRQFLKSDSKTVSLNLCMAYTIETSTECFHPLVVFKTAPIHYSQMPIPKLRIPEPTQQSSQQSMISTDSLLSVTCFSPMLYLYGIIILYLQRNKIQNTLELCGQEGRE